MSELTPMFSYNFLSARIHDVLKKVIANPDIGQASEKIISDVLDQILDDIYCECKREMIGKNNGEVTLEVPMFNTPLSELDVMARLEFIMSHAVSLDEIHELEQRRIASWFSSRFS